jgi:hypothetical protein
MSVPTHSAARSRAKVSWASGVEVDSDDTLLPTFRIPT